jgi:hypothetical protein
VALCNASARLAATTAAACVRAACHLHETAAARSFLAPIPEAKRVALAVECRALGTEIATPTTPASKPALPTPKPVPPPATDDCDAHPMDCRR